jgi:hypothetical protein
LAIKNVAKGLKAMSVACPLASIALDIFFGSQPDP